jgi:hypothetical protein
MRLTLRTLLAWLDDTLHPTQVREIGNQVASSPLAQELSERIHRVTRQRRLSVPSGSGADGIDPNIVASYVDNDLDPEAVSEYEKKCLTSDVNLAEVASVHQILSLLGQKVQVPAAARSRMYQLVKGRETRPPKPRRAKGPEAPEPVTKPIPPWVVPDEPKRHWIERFGPVVACLLLIALSSWSAWRSLTGGSTSSPITPRSLDEVAKDRSPAAPIRQAESEPAGTVPGAAPGAGAAGAAGATEEAGRDMEPVESAGSKTAKASEPAPLPVVPPGSAGITEPPDGILVRYNSDRQWERLTKATPVARSDRLVCLAAFRATIALGKTKIVMVDGTEVRILSQAADQVPALELLQGRLLVQQPSSSAFKVTFSGRTVTIEAREDSRIALERLVRRGIGQPITSAAPLLIACAQGELSASVDKKQESLTSSAMVTVDAAGAMKQGTEETLPAWMTAPEPSPAELQIREQFLRVFHPGRPVLADVVTANDDTRPEIKQLSVAALGTLGALSDLISVLSRKDDPLARRSAVAAIRAYMGLGRDAVARVHEQLSREFDEETAAVVEKVLVGYSAADASSPETYARLVELLSPDHDSPGVRELAHDTLKRLTGRGDLGYNPDHVDAKAVSDWKDLLRRGELRPVPMPRKAK